MTVFHAWYKSKFISNENEYCFALIDKKKCALYFTQAPNFICKDRKLLSLEAKMSKKRKCNSNLSDDEEDSYSTNCKKPKIVFEVNFYFLPIFYTVQTG